MTNEGLRIEVQKRYKQGDTITLKIWDIEGKPRKKTKATIIDFYQFYVLLEINGFKECYKYWDILQMTEEPKKDVSLGRHSRGSYNYKVT